MADPSDYTSAFDALKAMLDQYGLGSLSTAVTKLLTDGYTQDQVSVLLQDTPEYKQRFSGNEARKAAGIPVLSPKDYLSVESAYRQILSTSGMPQGFYDQPSDFASWIGKDVSPQEVSSRVQIAVDTANRMDDNAKQILSQWYGVGPNDFAAFALDQQRALPLLTKISNAASIGQDALRDNIGINQSQAEQLGGLVGSRNVDQLWQQTSEAAKRGNELSNIYGGVDYTTMDAAQEVFGNSQAAKQKRLDLSAQETSAFSGRSGLGQGSLSKNNNY